MARGTTIKYVVSLGPETKYVRVPSLSGCTEEEARQKIEGAGLTVGEVSYVNSSVSEGYVVSQTASAGDSVEEGTRIGFSISMGTGESPTDPGTGGETGDGSGTEVTE